MPKKAKFGKGEVSVETALDWLGRYGIWLLLSLLIFMGIMFKVYPKMSELFNLIKNIINCLSLNLGGCWEVLKSAIGRL